jgi:hypothetical protein
MAFFTIFIPPGLSEGEYAQAIRSGPSEVSSRRRTHQEMLTAARFSSVDEIDLTAEFLKTARAWIDGRDRYADKLIDAEGEALFNERRNDSLAQLSAIEAGLLRRSLFVCH